MKVIRILDPELAAVVAACNADAPDSLTPRWGDRANHVAAARRLRETPGTWEIVATYRGATSAYSMRNHVRAGANSSYVPAGTYEAEVAPVGLGSGLFVRFIGDTG